MITEKRAMSESTYGAAITLLFVVLSCTAWYHLWVKPNDARMREIRDCIYIEKTRLHHGVSQNVRLDDDFGLYAWCVEKVGR